MSLTSQLLRGLRLTVVVWLLTVVVITLPLLGIARVLAPGSAGGSLVRHRGAVVGSRLLGQPFSSDRYLQGRPSGAPNLAPSNPELARRIARASERWRQAGVEQPAADLLMDSASGVDPHISVRAARQQLARLAANRGLAPEQLESLLLQHLEGPWRLQAIEPLVNVLGFNLALDGLTGP
jgi:K+-transporting ATPase ATPase C chain